MAWAIVVQGRTDPGRILLIIEDRREAETLAYEIRRKLNRIAVEPYPRRETPAGTNDRSRELHAVSF